MLAFLPAPLRGFIASVLLGINTIFWCFLLYIPALLKLIPIPVWQKACTRLIILISEAWVTCNSGWMRLTQPTRWEVTGLEGLKYEGWYLVISNHQSWVDIFALQHILTRRIPFLKFFIKKELIWVPVIGLAWWGLDFPFMTRSTPEQIAKNPALKGKDIEATRKACEKFRTTPVSVMNFIEGTRFTEGKHGRQNSPYANLLKPKLGGTGFVLSTMGDYLHTMLDVTLYYPDGRPGLWEFMCGKVKRIQVDIEKVEIPAEFRGKDPDADEFRLAFKSWMEARWQTKDQKLSALKNEKV